VLHYSAAFLPCLDIAIGCSLLKSASEFFLIGWCIEQNDLQQHFLQSHDTVWYQYLLRHAGQLWLNHPHSYGYQVLLALENHLQRIAHFDECVKEAVNLFLKCFLSCKTLPWFWKFLGCSGSAPDKYCSSNCFCNLANSGPDNIHFLNAVAFSVSPIQLPEPFTWAFSCSCAWSTGITENFLLIFDRTQWHCFSNSSLIGMGKHYCL